MASKSAASEMRDRIAKSVAALIGKVDAKKFDAKAISEGLEKVGIAPSSKLDLVGRATLLLEHFVRTEETLGPEAMGDCRNCGAPSTLADFESCPFCGQGEDDAKPALAAVPEPGDEADDSDVPPAEYADEGDSGAEVPETVGSTPPPAVVPPPSPVAGQKLVAKGKGKKGAKKEKPGAVAEEEKPATALAVVPPAASRPAQTSTPIEGVFDGMSRFDRCVAELKNARRAAEVGGYLFAKRLAEAEISSDWKTKLDDDKKPVYRNFETFAHIELGMTGKYTRELLLVYKNFNEEQFRKIGPTKLRLVLQVEPDARPNVLERLKGGASRREVEQEVLGRKEGGGDQRPPSPRRETRVRHEPVTKPRPKAPAPKEGGKVTLAIAEGKKVFPLFVKPEKKGDPEVPAEAKSRTEATFAQVPWGKLPLLVNDVEVLITFRVNAKGKLEGVAEARRVDPAKAAK